MYNVINSVFKKLYIFLNDSRGKDRDDILDKISEFISFAKLAFKHPSYSYECEIRIVKTINTKDAPLTEEYKQKKWYI